MPSFHWYFRRLQTMSPAEIVWRLQSKIRDSGDRLRLATGNWPSRRDAITSVSKEPSFRLSECQPGCWSSPLPHEEGWLSALLKKADAVLENRLSYFDLENHFHGNPFNWNRDHNQQIDSPLCFAQSIDYRDVNKAGDCKLVWEPNRCHHIVVLARAYRATGDMKYAHGVVAHLVSWMDSNPVGRGMNWRSPMELSIRVINWGWALDYIYESGLFKGEFRERVLHSIYLHLWDVTRKFSKGSSANNHLIGEAAGVFIAACYFPELNNSSPWLEESRRILEQEIREQTFADGCNKEQALSYHLFTLWFFIFSGLVGKKSGRDFSEGYWQTVEKQLVFLGRLTEGGGRLQMYGDCDDGYVLDLGITPDDPYSPLAIGAVIFNRPDFKQWSRNYREAAFWLFGPESRQRYEQLQLSQRASDLSSAEFKDAGIYLLQHGRQDSADSISVYFDCGPLGYQSIAAHGHADALSFTLRAFGEDILVDPGTYDYFTYPDWRTYFRSTRAHNTVEIDGIDQSVMLGPFMWGERAECELLKWETGLGKTVVAATHNGYRRLADPVTHEREIVLDGTNKDLTITDRLDCSKSHDAVLYFHLSESCRVQHMQNNTVTIVCHKGSVVLDIDPKLTVSTLDGSLNPKGGWVSRAYHKKEKGVTILAKSRIAGKVEFQCRIAVIPS